MFAFGGEAGQARHGGDLAAARRLFPYAPEPFVDLSTGINPEPYPMPNLAADTFAHLPDPAAAEVLAAVAAQAYGATSASHVVPAPGTQILLPIVAGLTKPGRAVVLTPSYSEFAPAAGRAGHSVCAIGELTADIDAKLVIVANPNNPDGRLTAKNVLIALADRLGGRGGVLMVDEAFTDVGPPETSLVPETFRGNIVVLRSFGKFFGLAGVRLGFAIAAPPLAARISAQLGPWAVSGPALAVGIKALADAQWIEAAKLRLSEAAARLDPLLTGAGLHIVGGTTLFRLIESPAANRLFRHLGQAGILTRRFADREDWLRCGLPASEQAWGRLQTALADFRRR
jgi:cobalamin biosynthesis protein CobC